ncbi:MAG: hypothetical protein P1P85_05530 [Patescibacteria group bacterium]|nr:hypothetical protein [Patescibacteria group bacterium]
MDIDKINIYYPKELWEKRLRKNFSFTRVRYSCLGEEYNKWLYKTRIRILDEMIDKNNIFCKRKKF